jgi:hypothetical protein
MNYERCVPPQQLEGVIASPALIDGTTRPFKSAASGLVQSIKTFPARFPLESIAFWAAGHGTVRTFPNRAASGILLVFMRGVNQA